MDFRKHVPKNGTNEISFLSLVLDIPVLNQFHNLTLYCRIQYQAEITPQRGHGCATMHGCF